MASHPQSSHCRSFAQSGRSLRNIRDGHRNTGPNKFSGYAIVKQGLISSCSHFRRNGIHIFPEGIKLNRFTFCVSRPKNIKFAQARNLVRAIKNILYDTCFIKIYIYIFFFLGNPHFAWRSG